MAIKSIATLVVGAVISVVLLVTVLIPIVTDSAPTGDVTYTNDGIRMSPVGDQTITITYGDRNWNVAGTDLGYVEGPITQGTIMFYSQTLSGQAGMQYINNNGEYQRYGVSSTSHVTAEYVGADKIVNLTSIIGDNTYTSSYPYVGEVYYKDASGDYVWSSQKPEPAYIPENWDKFNTWSIQDQHFYAIIGETIMVDGVISPEGVTYTNSISSMDDVEGVNILDSYVLNIPNQDPITCRGYILPYQVTGFNDDQAMIGDLIVLIPLLMIIGLVMAIAYSLVMKRE